MDILSRIDWNQVGPLTAILLVLAIVGLACAPLLFKWLIKREDGTTALKRQQAEYEAEYKKKQQEIEANVPKELLAKFRVALKKKGEDICSVEKVTGNENCIGIGDERLDTWVPTLKEGYYVYGDKTYSSNSYVFDIDGDLLSE